MADLGRREALKTVGAGAALVGAACAGGVAGNLIGGREAAAATAANAGTNADTGAASALWFLPLAQGMREERDDRIAVEGDWPADLRGTLFRNGPGLFERAGRRKGHVLDGDGMIRAYTLDDDGLRFRNRFVRTDKFRAEQTAGRFLHATWGTRKSGGFLNNIGGTDMISQAGITPVWHAERLLAFDEVGLPWRVDPSSLETLGEAQVGPELETPAYKAHVKIDPTNGDLILLGPIMGRSMALRIVIHDKAGRLKTNFVVPAPRQTYVHDFFATERHVVVNLHAAEFAPFGFLAGFNSFTEALSWNGDAGNIVMVIDKSGSGTPRTFEAPGAWMWHAANAYEHGSEIIADQVAYDTPDHFLGADALFATIMQGRDGVASSPGTLRRWRIDLAGGGLRESIVDGGHFEFPMIDPRLATRRYRHAYLAATSRPGQWWHDGIARIDVETGDKRAFAFGEKTYVGEPVFAARPGGGTDDGWLLAEVFDGATVRNGLAVFEAASLDRGPIAMAWLGHSLPLSFHGTWLAA